MPHLGTREAGVKITSNSGDISSVKDRSFPLPLPVYKLFQVWDKKLVPEYKSTKHMFSSAENVFL